MTTVSLGDHKSVHTPTIFSSKSYNKTTNLEMIGHRRFYQIKL